MVNRLRKPTPGEIQLSPFPPYRILNQELYMFFHKVGHVSRHFFDSALLAVKVFSKQPRFLCSLKLFLDSIHLHLSLEQIYGLSFCM
ncbi:hypothetical protein GEMRC1_000626 [Eukaryota sp. GEM-RC1]